MSSATTGFLLAYYSTILGQFSMPPSLGPHPSTPKSSGEQKPGEDAPSYGGLGTFANEVESEQLLKILASPACVWMGDQGAQPLFRY